MNDARPILGLTVGDPAGIGPEIAVAAAVDHHIGLRARAVLYGDVSVIERAAKILGVERKVREVETPTAAGDASGVIDVVDIGVISDADQVRFGEVQQSAGRAALSAIERSVQDALAGRIAGVVTGPINKEAIWATGSSFLGHTEMLQDLTGAEKTDTMFVLEGLCTFFATRHMSLLEAVTSIKKDLLVDSIRRALRALEVFGVPQPRLAVAALNPHAGEGGHFGREEIDEIAPAIALVNEQTGAGVVGPVPADSVFHFGLEGEFDAVLSLYHDQGHIATKTRDFSRTVSVTVGLPILRTSVDHGTAFDIAGTGTASPLTMISAVDAAIRFSARNREIAAAYPGSPRGGSASDGQT